jgi:hypothetical protein
VTPAAELPAGSEGDSSVTLSVSVIGSFRQHYEAVMLVVKEFESLGAAVRSPVVSRIINPGACYVRFETDSPQSSDQLIQAMTLGKILGSDLVYVVAPAGYIGQTTCYELGRVHERSIPTYFSETPCDLPIEISTESVLGVYDLMRRMTGNLSLVVVAGLQRGRSPATIAAVWRVSCTLAIDSLRSAPWVLPVSHLGVPGPTM